MVYTAFANLIGEINNLMYSFVLIVLLLGVGLYFTLRTRLVQLRMLPESIRVVGEKSGGKNSISAFEALMVSTASRVGTGNIVGVAGAICIGGYGAVFWMWLIAIIGGASAFVESTLAQIYKVRDRQGGSYGGPSYYIQAALNSRVLGVIFALVLIFTYAGGFNMLASFNLIATMKGYSFYQQVNVPVIGGAVLAVLVAICILGGGKKLVKVTGVLVPVMGVLYILMALVVMVINLELLPQVFKAIFVGAFDFEAIFGGFAGSAMMQGIKRGLFSNEAGVGSAPNAAAAADVSHPVKQGLVQMLSVFIDTILICSTTAFMLLLSGVPIDAYSEGMNFVQAAVHSQVGPFGPLFITVSIFLFAFSSLVGNYYYTESNFRFIRDSKTGLLVFRLTCVAAIFIGAQMSFSMVWDLADVLMGLMALVNLVAILLLGGKAIRVLKDYQKQRRAGKNPVYRYDEVGVGSPEIWNEAHAKKWED